MTIDSRMEVLQWDKKNWDQNSDSDMFLALIVHGLVDAGEATVI